MAFTFKHGDRPLEGYEIQRGLGRGGFGEVYYAVSDGGREVALKYLHSHHDIELRGVSHCINMKSPYLVSVFDVVRSAGGDYFVIMEHISGPSLRDLMEQDPHGMPVEKAAFFMREIARGLQYLHDRGIVHRDLKPGNIFYEEGYVKIGDYGLSKFIAQSAGDRNTQSVGTVHYMAPEVGSGHYTRSIDIYALGVILYEMLLGRVPFEGQSTGEVLMKHLMNQPEVDELPEPFPAVIRKALAKDPRDRYADVKDLVDDALGPGRFERLDTDSLTPVAAFAARHLRGEAATLPVVPTPPRPTFGGSSAQGFRPLGAGQPAGDDRPRVRFAGFWIRALAVLIDAVILVPLWAVAPFNLLLWWLYSAVLLAYWDGQTVGKRVCGIRVIHADGGPLGFGHALGREAAKVLSNLTLGIGYLLAGITERKQALHDLVTGTYVVHRTPDATIPLPHRSEAMARRRRPTAAAPQRRERVRSQYRNAGTA